MSEETRAVEYRRKMTARAAWERDQRYNALPGDADAKAELDAAWEPVVNKDRGWDPPASYESGEPVPTPLGPHRVGEGRQLA